MLRMLLGMIPFLGISYDLKVYGNAWTLNDKLNYFIVFFLMLIVDACAISYKPNFVKLFNSNRWKVYSNVYSSLEGHL
jgi:hypothetical protein